MRYPPHFEWFSFKEICEIIGICYPLKPKMDNSTTSIKSIEDKNESNRNNTSTI